MLSSLLGILKEILRPAPVLLLALAAGIGAGDRSRLHAAAGDLHERLRRGAGDLEVAKVEEVHVRGGVDGAQTAVDRERLHRRRCAEALRRNDLEGVAGVDVLDDAADVGLELLTRHIGGELRDLAPALASRPWDGPAQPLTQARERADRTRVSGVQIGVLVGEGVGHQGELVAHVIEGHQHVAHHQSHVGEADGVGIRLAQRLDRADQVVAEDADGPAGERRQVSCVRELVARQVAAHLAVWIVDLADRVRLGVGRHIAAPLAELPARVAQHRARPKAEERVAAQAPLLR